jgi:hypothetical protein
MHDVDQVAKIAAEPIELPHDERVAVAKSFETRLDAGAIIELAACSVAVEIAFGNAGRDQRVRCRSKTCEPSALLTRM